MLLLVAGMAQAEQGLLVIYDSRDDNSVEKTLRLVQQLKSLRSSGHFGESMTFASADLNIPAYANYMATLGVKKPVPIPYLAVARMANGQPRKVLWGVKVTDVGKAIGALDTRLGLQPARLADTPPPWAQAATQDTSREALAEMLLRIEGMTR